jgi:hypothetical protein
MIQQWEYETYLTFLEWAENKYNLKLMGSQGWELIAVVRHLIIFKQYIFKRPKSIS